MIDHFEIKTTRFEDCLVFYKAVLEPLGVELKWSDSAAAGFGLAREPNVRFLIEKSDAPARCHIAFSAPDAQAVDAFFAHGIAVGATGNGEPGLRELLDQI